MELKHIIIAVAVAIVALIGYNFYSTTKTEKELAEKQAKIEQTKAQAALMEKEMELKRMQEQMQKQSGTTIIQPTQQTQAQPVQPTNQPAVEIKSVDVGSDTQKQKEEHAKIMGQIANAHKQMSSLVSAGLDAPESQHDRILAQMRQLRVSTVAINTGNLKCAEESKRKLVDAIDYSIQATQAYFSGSSISASVSEQTLAKIQESGIASEACIHSLSY